MNTFQNIVYIGAAFATVAKAACTMERAQDCIDFEYMQLAVEDYAGDYTWRFYTTNSKDGYETRLFRFEGDETGLPIDNQWSQGPVLLYNTATRDCKSWFTESLSAEMDSIPKQLFDAGYDVWIGCKRGSIYSHLHRTPFEGDVPEPTIKPNVLKHSDEEEEEFWDFNTGTIGEYEIPKMVAKIQQVTREGDEVRTCKKVQIIAHALGSAEALVTLSTFPETSERLVSHLINLAPCPIPTYQQDDDDRRILSAKTEMTAEPPRELSEEVSELVAEKENRLLKR